MWKVVLILFLIPGAAFAQNTSSNCYMMGPTWHCDANTTPAPSNSGINIDWGNLGTRPDPNAFMTGYNNARTMELDRRARQLELEESRAQAEAVALSQAQASQERQRAELAQNALDKFRSSRCDDAVDTGPRYREVELATRAKAFCFEPPPHK